MLNGVAHAHQKTQPIVFVLVAIALVAAVGGFIYHIKLCYAEHTSILSEQVRYSTLLQSPVSFNLLIQIRL